MIIPDITPEYRKTNLVISITLLVSLLMPYFFYVKEVDPKRYFFQLDSIKSCYQSTKGMVCSSTGLTRSIKSLYNGFYTQSLRYNRSGIIFFLMLIAQLLLRLVVFNLKSHLVPWVDILQILISICLAKYLLNLN